MSTLLIRLSGPMQSWGTQSRFSVRDTGLEPSKSGVIGLLCAALGRPREATVEDLARLKMGVRVDREGLLRVDYQTAGGTHRLHERYGVAKANGGTPETVQSNRYYLADAAFLVGLYGEDTALLHALNQALDAPVWQLCLGRKSYVPVEPIRLPGHTLGGPAVQDKPLTAALAEYPWLGQPGSRVREAPTRVRAVLEDAEHGTEVRNDVPISFDKRQFGTRQVRTVSMIAVGGPYVSFALDPEHTQRHRA